MNSLLCIQLHILWKLLKVIIWNRTSNPPGYICENGQMDQYFFHYLSFFFSTHWYPSSSFKALSGTCWPNLRSRINTRCGWKVMSYVKGTKRIRNSTRIVTLGLETLLRMRMRLGSNWKWKDKGNSHFYFISL